MKKMSSIRKARQLALLTCYPKNPSASVAGSDPGDSPN